MNRLILSLLILWAALAIACGGPRDGLSDAAKARLTDSCRQHYDAAGRLHTECRSR